jgi:tRNA threonylcarbamoyladenosine biosynthesis protein TsaB
VDARAKPAQGDQQALQVIMLVLGFDSAGVGASAVVLRDGAMVASRAAGAARGQAEILMPMIADVLAEARTDAASLDLIGVATGPGSFTGLRIAIAAARGLALAAGVPAIAVSRFAAVAARFPAERRERRALLVALDTRRDDFFLQLFTDHADEPRLSTGEAAARTLPKIPLLLVGDAAPRLATALTGRDFVIPDDADLPCAEQVARLAAAEHRPGVVPPPPRPLYLRAPDTTMPRSARP